MNIFIGICVAVFLALFLLAEFSIQQSLGY